VCVRATFCYSREIWSLLILRVSARRAHIDSPPLSPPPPPPPPLLFVLVGVFNARARIYTEPPRNARGFRCVAILYDKGPLTFPRASPRATRTHASLPRFSRADASSFYSVLRRRRYGFLLCGTEDDEGTVMRGKADSYRSVAWTREGREIRGCDSLYRRVTV